jgi:hypothetical protein
MKERSLIASLVASIAVLAVSGCGGSSHDDDSAPDPYSGSSGGYSGSYAGGTTGSVSSSCAKQTLDGLITDSGTRSISTNITEENFPIVCPIAAASDMRIFSEYDLGGTVLTPTVYEAAINRLGYRAATIAELLVWAKEAWDGSGYIAALGSKWLAADGTYITYLNTSGGTRLLEMWGVSPTVTWKAGWTFLAVRGSTGSSGTTGNGGTTGNSGTTGKGGTTGSSTKPTPTMNCKEFSSPGCSTYSSTTFGSICINAGCHFDLGDCESHGDFSDPTCECTCY